MKVSFAECCCDHWFSYNQQWLLDGHINEGLEMFCFSVMEYKFYFGNVNNNNNNNNNSNNNNK